MGQPQRDTALGLGIVTDISGRRVTLGFPAADEERTYAIDNAPLSRIVYQQGEEIETFDGERYTVRRSGRFLMAFWCTTPMTVRIFSRFPS